MSKELYKLNKELIELVNKYSETGLPIGQWSPSKSFILFTFAKSYKTLNSVLILCERGNGQDAFILVRSLFELMLITKYIFKEDTDERIRLFNEYDWILRDRMLRGALKNDATSNMLIIKADENRIDFKEIKARAKAHRKTYTEGDADTWSKKSVWQMAKDVKSEDLYNSLYTLGSQLVHSGSRSATEYFKIINGEVDLQTYANYSYVNESLIGGFEFFLQIVKDLNKILELNLENELNNLEQRMVSIVESLNN
ncbi:hypothetical protein DOJK_00486 [Patescibacteria group bacterium]|nr:hypothetical protein DOJK_00486 [Patescibacteria group bacterium]